MYAKHAQSRMRASDCVSHVCAYVPVASAVPSWLHRTASTAPVCPSVIFSTFPLLDRRAKRPGVKGGTKEEEGREERRGRDGGVRRE